MTNTIKSSSAPLSRTNLELHYQVAMPQPESHLFVVKLNLRGWTQDVLDLRMPVWTPGSYLVREYSKHLQDFTVEAAQPLSWRKISKNHWQIDTHGVSELTVQYRIYANELSVRTNHLDATHGYFNGAALFFYISGFEQNAVRVTVEPPFSNWSVYTSLPPVPNQPHTFEAADFDTLVDSPFEIGPHPLYEFEALGKPHQFCIWGRGNAAPNRIIEDTQKIIETEAALFGGLPYDNYLFILHLSSQGFGGLEHKNSCTLNYPRLGFRKPEKYHRFMQLVAHEFFHLWNVKRIRPKALEVFNYGAESYTPSLWFSEGTTSYYDVVIPFRAEIYDIHAFLKLLGKEITRFLTIPGRRVQSLSESSFDAWIKLYRRDANSDNSQISYYLKGEMVSLLIDLLIRERHDNQRSLDDVMRQMWVKFGQSEIGFTPEQLEAVISSVADVDLTDFFHQCLHSTDDLPFEQLLEPFGLQLQAENEEDISPFLGITVKSEQGREVIKFVEADSPAQRAGLDAGDELLAVDGLRVSADQLSDRLKDYQPGDTVQLAVFHQDELLLRTVQLGDPRPTSYQLTPVAHPSSTQQRNFKGWLGVDLSVLSKAT